MNVQSLHAVSLSEIQKRLLNDFQHNFPLSPNPYAEIAEQLNISEQTVIQYLKELSNQKVISRVGPVFRPHSIGKSTLATMHVPTSRLLEIANYISSLPEVNHNYEREHYFNLWFVVTAIDEEHLEDVLNEIEQETYLSVMSLPMLEDYHIDLGFDLCF
ncbi:MAG: hypothetical protein RIT27_759 [Pseudomonadota bacterium]|jgi:DNA-binding Lrp family transcriptional regulator